MIIETNILRLEKDSLNAYASVETQILLQLPPREAENALCFAFSYVFRDNDHLTFHYEPFF